MRRCDTCKFWDQSGLPHCSPHSDSGRCKALPPVPDDRNEVARWPVTDFLDWCGAHSPRIDWPFKRQDDDIPF